MNSSRRYSFVLHNFSKIEPPILDINSNTSQNVPIINEQNKNNNILNDKYRKINLFLIDLLKEINNMLCYYDSFINKECGVIKNMPNVAKNLINDINDLIEEQKKKMIGKEFMRNMDIIFKKIEEYVNKNNNSEIKHNLFLKYSSSKPNIKNEKSNNNNVKDNNNNLKSKNNNIINNQKDIKKDSNSNKKK